MDASGAPDGEAPVANVGAPALHRQSYVDTSHPGTRAPPRLALNIGAVSAEASKEVLQPRTPRLLQAAERHVRVELDMLGAGKVFGFSGSRGGSQANALEADTRVELVQWSRAEVEAKLGPLLSFLWNPMETEGSLAASHTAMKC
ncbi:hypothetical protein HaLaN_07030 [Haematococcus lacustris]|uniref:Uncharacterized protein n=1 Tax=Haematococcus lacustris TaxID=44745 RepID=A0A699YPM7_HAELA|nr:hypothetical protein HaLaN_07030 [Haematococcus lacustris]